MIKSNWMQGVLTRQTVSRVLYRCILPALAFYLVSLAVMSAAVTSSGSMSRLPSISCRWR